MRAPSRLALLGLVLLGVGALTVLFRGPLSSTLRPLTAPSEDTVAENVRTFAKLYGYVRYFHPSDAAANINWDKFAIHGVRQVKNAANRSELKTKLEALFEPIAPTVKLYSTGEETPPPADVLSPSDTSGLNLVAWQHQGVGTGSPEDWTFYRSYRLHRGPEEGPLFSAKPTPGESAEKPLGRGLAAQVPLALYSKNDQVLRPNDAPSATTLYTKLDSVEADALTSQSDALRLANVTIAWNVFQHFYPYLGVVDVDWNQVLSRTLRRTLDDESQEEFLQSLRRMIAQLDDGHGRVFHTGKSSKTGLPIRVDRIEDEVVVVDTAEYVDKDLCVGPGDVVVSINGRPAMKDLKDTKRYISGSPQWTQVRALQQFGVGEPGSTVSLVLRRGQTEWECQVSRATRLNEKIRMRELQRDPGIDAIETLRHGIHYVDLTRTEWATLQEHLSQLAQADGIVFDLRGYPKRDNRKILTHLSTDTLRSPRFQIPQFIYPDQKNQVGYDTSGRWTLFPKKPHITGDVVFLTNARAISRAETIMSITEHYQLGEIVGQPTAGTNGDINPFGLPGNYKVVWTGMRVRKHDGSQHHLVGIQPGVPVERTIEGARKGEDEVLQKALEVLQEDDPTDNKRSSR